MKQFDSVIFDIDGTIWDSTEVVAQSYNDVFERENVDRRVTSDDLRGLFGRTMDEIFDKLFPDTDEKLKRKLQEGCVEAEQIKLKNTPGKFYEGIIETINRLAEKYPLYIVSNAQSGYIEKVMAYGGFEKEIKAHLCFGDTGVSKGETIKILMEREKINNPVYIGDIQGDADACKKAGIDIIYASYGFGKIENPYAVIDKPLDLLNIL